MSLILESARLAKVQIQNQGSYDREGWAYFNHESDKLEPFGYVAIDLVEENVFGSKILSEMGERAVNFGEPLGPFNVTTPEGLEYTELYFANKQFGQFFSIQMPGSIKAKEILNALNQDKVALRDLGISVKLEAVGVGLGAAFLSSIRTRDK